MMLETIENPIFEQEYLFVVNGPYEHLDWPVYINRSFWEHHRLKDRLHCIPVTAANLYQ